MPGFALKRLFKARNRRPRRHVRLFAWAFVISLIVGLIEFGEPLENMLRVMRNEFHRDRASGQVVVVGIDADSLEQVDQWPWPRRYHAKMLDKLDELGVRKIFIDFTMSEHSRPEDDRALAHSIARIGSKVFLINRMYVDPANGRETVLYALPEFVKDAGQVNANFNYDYSGAVWQMPYQWMLEKKAWPSISALITGKQGLVGERFKIDWSIDPRTVPVVSAVDVLNGKVDAKVLRGKDVIYAPATMSLGDYYMAPGYSMVPGGVIHAVAADTLARGNPVNLGWIPAFVLTLLAGAISLITGNRVVRPAVLATAFGLLIIAPVLLESRTIFVDIVPGFLFLAILGGSLGWSTFRQKLHDRGYTNVVTGLANINALREIAPKPGSALIVARVHNFASIKALIPASDEKALVDQLVARFEVAAGDAVIYQADDGGFAWLHENAGEIVIGDHLEALAAFFTSPLAVSGRAVPVVVSFGVDRKDEAAPFNRYGDAMLAAEEAVRMGLRWRDADPDASQRVDDQLRLLNDLEAAVDTDQIWLAFQPQLDLATGKISGAEALVRWDHPEHGSVSPDKFVVLAEEQGRMTDLTLRVIRDAISAAAVLNRGGRRFEMGINLSTRVTGVNRIASEIEALVRACDLDPSVLTFEVTETASLHSEAGFMDLLYRLRAFGVKVSVDDYGTGHSTLAYVQSMPASELKLDRRFIADLETSPDNQKLVQATVDMAHGLGWRIVAEGVETSETLECVRTLGCDRAQGWVVARPMALKELTRWVQGRVAARAA